MAKTKPPNSGRSRSIPKKYSDGVGRLLWESEAEYSIYLIFARLPETTGIPDRDLGESIATMISSGVVDGWTQSELTSIATKNDWVGRSKAFDKTFTPKVNPTAIGRIEDAEKDGSELAAIAANLMRARMIQAPQTLKNSELIALMKLAPVLNRSESTVLKEV